MNSKKWNIGELNKGKHLSDSLKRKISLKTRATYRAGRVAWNKGVSMSSHTRHKISISKTGSKPWNVGIARTEEERKKISQGRMGKPAWNKGKIWTSKEKIKMSDGAKRMWERRRKLIEA